jgi:hypothetical protein
VSEKRRETKEIEVDFDRLARISNKVNELLVKRTKGSVEAYGVLRLLCVYYEEDLGISFAPEFEAELRKVVKRSLENKQKSSESPQTDA